MKRLICAVCGNTIKKGEQVAEFTSCGDDRIFTHVMSSDNNYDCDYLYMQEQLVPSFYSSKDEIDFDL